jgi:hypothetical protein
VKAGGCGLEVGLPEKYLGRAVHYDGIIRALMPARHGRPLGQHCEGGFRAFHGVVEGVAFVRFAACFEDQFQHF